MKKVMTREEFKVRWESNDDGGGITFDDVSRCAVEWGLYNHPKTATIAQVRYAILKAANTVDAEEYNPDNEEDE